VQTGPWQLCGYTAEGLLREHLPHQRNGGEWNHLRHSAARSSMIRRCTNDDIPTVEAIINKAAEAYRGVIPADCWHEPYMLRSELLDEIAKGVQFWGWQEAGVLVGVMGLQKIRDVTLIRHAYVRPSHQSRGVGSALLKRLVAQISTPLLVGTWASAEWAIRFYERHGFRLVGAEEKDRLLTTYWNIPSRQRETSVVLAMPVPHPT
jgi:N-acetylglutamate synthase-like GNAT family acetyltransferase